MKNIITLLFIFVVLPPSLRAQYSIQYIGDTEPNQCTGTILASVGSAETGPFTMELFLNTSSGQSSTAIKSNVTSLANFSNLCEGDYILLITDDFGCESELSATIEGCNDITLRNAPAAYVTHSTDCNAPNGEIGIISQSIFNGGTGYITWEWSGGTLGPQGIYDLAPGTYSLTATDEEGCEGIFSFAVEGEELWLQGNAFPTCAGQNSGAINVGATFSEGGPITYSWSNGATSEKIDGLAPGVYSVTATHAPSGCTATQSWAVSALPDLGNLTLTGDTQPSCIEQNTGSIATTVSGGTGPYTYAWSSNGFGAQSSYLPAKEYTITVTDYCGNVAVEEIEVEEFGESFFFTKKVLDDCNSNGTGYVEITSMPLNGATPSYYDLYLNQELVGNGLGWSGNLPIGNYEFTAVSANGCNATPFSFDISANSANANELHIVHDELSSIDCFKGEIKPTISGGTAPFAFNWSGPGINAGNKTNYVQYDLENGNYSLTVYDACGDFDARNYDLTCNCPIQFELEDNTPCSAPYTVSINVIEDFVFSLAQGLYEFEWFDITKQENRGSSTLYVGTDNSFTWENRTKTFLSAKEIQLEIKDPNGCFYNSSKITLSTHDMEEVDLNEWLGAYPDLQDLHPTLFVNPEVGQTLVQTDCGRFKECGSSIVEMTATGSYILFSDAPNSSNPCQAAGELVCSLDPSKSLEFGANGAATYFPNLGGNLCGCLFPPDLFVNHDIEHPIFVQFPCDDVNGTESSTTAVDTFNLFDTSLCSCDWCIFTHLETSSNCEYQVICGPTGQVIDTEVIPQEDWKICKTITQLNGENYQYIIQEFCPLNPCQFQTIGYGNWVDLSEDQLQEVNALPDCDCNVPSGAFVQNDFEEEYGGIDSVYLSGTKSISEASFNIFPVPSTDGRFFIQLNQHNLNIENLTVYAIDGKELNGFSFKNITKNEYMLKLDLSVPRGMYFVKIFYSKGLVNIGKLILQ